MKDEQYRNLMFKLTYLESVIENFADSIDTKKGGGYCECPICHSKFFAYLPFGGMLRKNAECPNCKSKERHRALWRIMEQLNWHKEGMNVLYFAPEAVFHKMFSSFTDIDYWPVDLEPDGYKGVVRKAVDITEIPFEDNSFDLIICNHILERIPDDKKAVHELYRVLTPETGMAFLNVTTFDIPVTLENPEYNTPELRLKYYGATNHLRAYGLDYPQRLKDAGFSVQLFTMADMDKQALKRYGLNKNEKIFLCRKE